MPVARTATPEDAEAAVRVLRRSITELCVGDHRSDPATLGEWLANKTVDSFRAWLASDRNFCVVTESDAAVNGVGLINRSGEVLLCYVTPEALGRGFGSALLAALESEARRWGVHKLRLDSTLFARRFYEKHGYVSAGDAVCSFGSSCGYPYEKALNTEM